MEAVQTSEFRVDRPEAAVQWSKPAHGNAALHFTVACLGETRNAEGLCSSDLTIRGSSFAAIAAVRPASSLLDPAGRCRGEEEGVGERRGILFNKKNDSAGGFL